MNNRLAFLLDTFQASRNAAFAANNGRPPAARDLRKLGLSEDRIKSCC